MVAVENVTKQAAEVTRYKNRHKALRISLKVIKRTSKTDNNSHEGTDGMDKVNNSQKAAQANGDRRSQSPGKWIRTVGI